MRRRGGVWPYGVIVLLIGLAVVACGTDPTPAAPPPADTPTPSNGDLEAWQAEWEETVRAAGEEGRLVVTVFDDRQRLAVLKFAEQFPEIEVEVQILPGREFVARVPSEMQAGIFDFDVYMSGSTTAASQLLPIGSIFDETRAELFLPEVIDDEMWVGGDFGDWWADDETQRYVPNPQATAGGQTWRVNREVAPDVQTLDDWLDPQLRGRICLEDPRVIGGGDTFWTVILMFHGEDMVRRLLTETEPRITRDLRQLAADTVRGDCAIAVGAGGFATFEEQGVTDHIEQLRLPLGEIPAEYSHIRVICCGEAKHKETVDDHISHGIGGPALLRNRPHPNAAKLFVNWWLSREGQQAWLEQDTTVETPEGRLANSCTGRVDLQRLCAPDTRPQPDKAYVSFRVASNIEFSDTSRELAQEILGR